MRTNLWACAGVIGLAACGIAGCQSGRAGAGAVVAGEPSAEATAAFERVKGLAGTWEMTDDKGQKQTALVITVISGGSVVHETMMPGGEHEMVNVYHLDGPRVLVTHYCAMGNQPRMACRGIGADGSLTFAFDSVTNLGSADQEFMGSLTLRQPTPGQLVQEWQSLKLDGQKTEHVRFELTRKSG